VATLVVENVRTFAGSHSLPLSQLTLLTGENSSGKSTLLAIMAALYDPSGFPFRPGFNRAPYNLGTYDTIATYKGGKFGRAKTFSIGFDTDSPDAKKAHRVIAHFCERDGQAGLAQLSVIGAEGSIELDITSQKEGAFSGRIHIAFPDLDTHEEFSLRSAPALGATAGIAEVILGLLFRRGPKQVDYRLIDRITQMTRQLSPGRSISLAPIRTRPERVYGQLSEPFDPGGDHIPFVLDRLLRDQDAKDTAAVLDALLTFGRASGLFSDVKVRKLGHKIGDPFQVMVNVGGRMRNLIDVGYGVSQAMPIVVELALASPRDLVLIQQPEVHLHPRAQAALGTLLATFVQKGKRKVVVETHSDYIIDRVRHEIATGRLEAQRVGLLFLDRPDLETRIHHLRVDDDGNIVGAPDAYRDFFLEEQLRVLQRSE
jgi:energy-coupling factor transporter ATP-binding protein EcfA2